MIVRYVRDIQFELTSNEDWDEVKATLSELPGFEVYHHSREEATFFYQLHDAQGIENFYRGIVRLYAALNDYNDPEDVNLRQQKREFLKEDLDNLLLNALTGLEATKVRNMTLLGQLAEANKDYGSLRRAGELLASLENASMRDHMSELYMERARASEFLENLRRQYTKEIEDEIRSQPKEDDTH
ncbi:MAG: hypothetical protein ACXVIR_11575 [Halobacteriota archaeon]